MSEMHFPICKLKTADVHGAREECYFHSNLMKNTFYPELLSKYVEKHDMQQTPPLSLQQHSDKDIIFWLESNRAWR